jgi:hypothetical protein
VLRFLSSRDVNSALRGDGAGQELAETASGLTLL